MEDQLRVSSFMSSKSDETLTFERFDAPNIASNERDVAAIVGANLRTLRRANGYSLEKLSEISKVSRAMLGQIETGKSVPTVTVLWKIADALKVPVTRLVQIEAASPVRVLRRAHAATSFSETGRFSRRALWEPWLEASATLFEFRVEATHSETFEAGAPGQRLTLVTAVGRLWVEIQDEEPVELSPGDAIIFNADMTYRIENKGAETVFAYVALSAAGGK